MNQFLVIIRGTPASGKSTIAKSFRDFSKKIVWLKVDNFKDFFSDDSSEALEYVNRSAIATLEYLLDEGFSVVMEGVFQDTKAIRFATNIAKQKSIPYNVFQTDIPLEIIKQRDLERPGVKEGLRKPLGDQALEQIYSVVKNTPYEGSVILDTNKYSLEECRKIIQDSLNYK
jgi:chloramphenicol 3-O-phosphotransferase